jgi:predicted 3-demethylubiquinone-9 3-methyltransferase (glyoxalase superfamily)
LSNRAPPVRRILEQANPNFLIIHQVMSAKITPCLWFDTQAEDAARYYIGIFQNSKITAISRYGEAGKEVHGKPPGSVLVVAFELNGQSFTALNGGPHFKFNEAISLQVECEDQAEVDYHWEKLSAGGDPQAQQCGWVKDKFGLSWQIVPKILPALISDPNSAKSQRAFAAMMQMKKLDIAALQRAYEG